MILIRAKNWKELNLTIKEMGLGNKKGFIKNVPYGLEMRLYNV